ncbi:MAG: metal-sulfur cluster assembly factor [Candidatus Poribacteria bacterium]|jgi:metal-sulfur cluster biosynthetic enzyme|nr:metal-sulfur cluster assembly factor [Candidatus Poribacteria bacterium]MDP6749787.1 metal-sulfur cluster assembly factor [Candidatus Poribacteria bacterium]MDP6998489.1 metal-sulfur cluster assembly factor [Candidatus Poribacteria bacterium]
MTERKDLSETAYQHRTDGIEEKLQLLSEAHRLGKIDLAMSLSESIKDTLAFERQVREPEIDYAPGLERTGQVSHLPQSWLSTPVSPKNHRLGEWSFYKVIAVREHCGLDRRQEPVDVAIRFEHIQDPRREVRVARLDANTGQLVETISQVYDQRDYHPAASSTSYALAKPQSCRLMFLADIEANASTVYLIFYGNSDAELPNYLSDLQTSGEGYGLRIENYHYAADLSAQMGQLERLTYKQAHGLELFAGGEGHGEPPNIDWAHDYLSSNQFQKFRVTNWATCPNYEVVKGPVCVQVQRWGFPHSPVHPLFTPSRMHIDVTYRFYAGLPYFIKEGKMEMSKDFELNYLRDDEWVFSGYAFTETVWIDRQGKLHEGQVPGNEQDDLWGVGFYNQHSRDAFIAIWLEHQADNFDALYHSGAPVLNYSGHGQLWSRWAARDNPQFHAGACLKQKNAYRVAPYSSESGREEVERLRLQLLNPLEIDAEVNLQNEVVPKIKVKAENRPNPDKGIGDTARVATAEMKEQIWQALRQVKDEMFYTVDANVVDMGYIYDLNLRGDVVYILMTMPHRGRPKYGFMATPIRHRLLKLDGIREVIVDFTWEPEWTVARLTPAGRLAMGLNDGLPSNPDD